MQVRHNNSLFDETVIVREDSQTSKKNMSPIPCSVTDLGCCLLANPKAKSKQNLITLRNSE